MEKLKNQLEGIDVTVKPDQTSFENVKYSKGSLFIS